jgi:GGDEF domain-containing protein
VDVSFVEGDEIAGEGGAVRVAVSDSGVGIPQDQLESIFEKFHQVEAQKRKLAPGTGLGLSICRELVKVHYGRIWAESEPGRGSRFSFVIPVLSQRELIERAISSSIDRARETGCPMALVVGRLVDVATLRSRRGEDDFERTMNDLVTVSRRVVRHSADLVLSRSERGEIVVILPRTMREGGRAFGDRLREELEKIGTDGAVALRIGSTQYPEDARSAADLYRLALENIGEVVVA